MFESHEHLPSPKLNHSRPMLLLLIMLLPTSAMSISPVQHHSNVSVSAQGMGYLFTTLTPCLFCGFICLLKTRLQNTAIVSAFTFRKLHVNTGMQLLWLSICLAWFPSFFHYLDVVIRTTAKFK